VVEVAGAHEGLGVRWGAAVCVVEEEAHCFREEVSFPEEKLKASGFRGTVWQRDDK
jgi:hypothetical protein